MRVTLEPVIFRVVFSLLSSVQVMRSGLCSMTKFSIRVSSGMSEVKEASESSAADEIERTGSGSLNTRTMAVPVVVPLRVRE